MMPLVLVWIHLLAAVTWIGGSLFLSLVLAPSYRAMAAKPDAGALFRTAAKRFRLVVWSGVALLLLTGPMLVIAHGWPLFEPSRWPTVLAGKLTLVALFLVLTAVHDLFLGPRVRTLLTVPPDRRSVSEQRLLAAASWLPRVALVIALGVLFAAVTLARL
ncbi:MAG: hypothetical protein U0412_14845 [Nitrospira sp.]